VTGSDPANPARSPVQEVRPLPRPDERDLRDQGREGESRRDDHDRVSDNSFCALRRCADATLKSGEPARHMESGSARYPERERLPERGSNYRDDGYDRAPRSAQRATPVSGYWFLK